MGGGGASCDEKWALSLKRKKQENSETPLLVFGIKSTGTQRAEVCYAQCENWVDGILGQRGARRGIRWSSEWPVPEWHLPNSFSINPGTEHGHPKATKDRNPRTESRISRWNSKSSPGAPATS